jgi:putative inorganic carbon (hco3(-)) transporter
MAVNRFPAVQRSYLASYLPSIVRPPAALLTLGLMLVAAALITRLPLALSALALVGAGLIVAVLIRPWVGLPVLAIAIPFAAIKPLPIVGLPLDGADLVLGLVIAAWLAQGVIHRRIVLPRTPLNLPLLAFIGVLTVSLVGAESYREGLPELVKWLQVLLLYWCVAAILPQNRAGWLIAGLLLAGIGQALLGLVQFVTQSGPEAFVLLGRFMRAYGTFRQPNPYAGYLGLVAPFAISLALWAWIGRASTTLSFHRGEAAANQRQVRILRITLTAAAAVISLGLLLSWSRGAWLAFAVAVAVVILAHTRRAAPIVLLGVALAVVVAVVFGLVDLLPASLVNRVSELQQFVGLVNIRVVEVTDANFSVIERIAHWQAALAMWADHPWLGVGIGNFATAYPAYNLPRWYEPLGHAHNVYLNFGAEAGLLGFIAYLALWVACLWQAVRAAAVSNRFVAAVGAGVLGALTHATVHNLFDNLWVQHNYLNLALFLGLLAVLTTNSHQSASQSISGEFVSNVPDA